MPEGILSAGRRLRSAFVIFAIVVASGSIGYMAIEGWTLVESLYMTLITVTTVGFREVKPLSEGGQVFTMFLVMGGVGAATYTAITAIELLVSKQVRWVIRGNRMEDQIKGRKNHMILCGYGRVGRFIADEYRRRHKPFVIVERDQAVVADITDVPVVVGDATEDASLKRAGVQRAASLICALASDADNAFVALTGRELNATIQITARADSEGMEQKLLRAGANRVVSPYQTGALRMAVTTLQPNVVDFMSVVSGGHHTDLRLEELRLDSGSPFVGKNLREVEFRQRYGLMVVGIKHESAETLFNPESTETMKEGDILLLIGSAEKLAECAGAAAFDQGA
jgi:voltage-gated potassium channel